MNTIHTEQLSARMAELDTDALNAMLDQRDGAEFESVWNEIFYSLAPLKHSPITDTVFLSISDATQQHEICSYIADDLNLIFAAEEKGIENKFLSWLKDEYVRGRFPHTLPNA
ncbi:MAG: hypothetical protein R3B84_20730 [Zavarzinella sp.]